MRTFTHLILLLTIVACTWGTVEAQVDSNSLQMDLLTPDDIINPPSQKQTVVSSNRTAQDLRDITYTMHVVTQQEILDNGYNTLVDVLKNVPGIKVSQPGSALDGESFMLRGLYGNYYTKILVNSIPIAPSVTGGMPIGAQLPIRQAERIEIIYGPAGAIYGSDAMAGVINIITKRPDKGVFAQVDISAGSLGYNGLNMMVGGKLGKGKHIMRYNLWGGFSEQDDLNVKYDEDFNYNERTYDPLAFFLDSPEYIGTIDTLGFDELFSSSNYFGSDFSYRGFTLSYQYMSRESHSAIGLSPLAANYTEVGSYFGEQMNRTSLNYQKKVRKLDFTTNISWLKFRMDPNTNIRSVFNFSSPGVKYSYAASDDLFAEQVVSWTPIESLSLVTGLSYKASGNLPYTSFLIEPFVENDYYFFSNENLNVPWKESTEVPGPGEPPRTISLSQDNYLPNPVNFSQASVFGELSYGGEQYRVQLGARYDANSRYGNSFSPRVAGLYKFTNDHILRASVSQANLVPSTFYRYNSLIKTSGSPGPMGEEGQEFFLPQSNTILKNEKLTTAELGMRNYWGKMVSWDVAVFYNQLEDHVSYSVQSSDLTTNPRNTDFIGYANGENAQLLGVQSNLTLKDLIEPIHLNTELFLSYAQGKFGLPSGGEINSWPMQPQFMGQLGITLSPVDALWISVRAHYSGEWISRGIWSEAQLGTDELVEREPFTSADVHVRYKIGRHYQLYSKVINVLNQEYAGIDATGTTFDLRYNPQMGRIVEFGLSFRFN